MHVVTLCQGINEIYVCLELPAWQIFQLVFPALSPMYLYCCCCCKIHPRVDTIVASLLPICHTYLKVAYRRVLEENTPMLWHGTTRGDVTMVLW